MKKILCILMFLSALAMKGQEYELVWKEDFRGRKMDGDKWARIERGPADWRRYMSSDESVYDLRNGKLILRAIVNDGVVPDDTATYLTGGVYTKGLFSMIYGKVEIRAKLQGAESLWPALWMLPESGKWPDDGEIDIMERLDHDTYIYQTVHTSYTRDLNKRTDPKSFVRAPFRPRRYNVFGVEIRPDMIVFTVNDIVTLTYPAIESEEYPRQIQFPFEVPYYILMDMQIGGAWVGPPDGSELPVEMSIDWVKVYFPK